MFIVSLTYHASLEQIDAYLAEHVAFLKEQYAQGHFLASGRKVPRTGGIILARAPLPKKLWRHSCITILFIATIWQAMTLSSLSLP